MESEPSSRHERPAERSSRRRLEILSSEREILEYLEAPENAVEIQTYWQYLMELTSFIQEHVSPSEQAGALIEAHAAIDRSRTIAGNLPPTLPTSRTFPIGEHMDVTVGNRANAQWPDSSKSSLALSDGGIVTPDLPVGIIDYYRNIARLNRDGSLTSFTRGLVADMTTSLGILAGEV